MKKPSIAVVGAGLAGLTAASDLQAAGFDVVVVDKARGPGGRMSTRRHGDLRFNHGAQYFTARDEVFWQAVDEWCRHGLVEPWGARIAVINGGIATHEATVDRYVGEPGMNAICAYLASRLADCRFNWKLTKSRFENGQWRLRNSNGDLVKSDYLLLTTPPEQARELAPSLAVEDALAAVTMMPCWAVMLSADERLLAGYDAAFVNSGPLSWLARQPGSTEGAEQWVLHANPQWSKENLEEQASDVAEQLIQAVRELPGAGSFETVEVIPHRWRYALAEEPLKSGCIMLKEHHLAIAGDWCNGSRVEGAYLSGKAAAKALIKGA